MDHSRAAVEIMVYLLVFLIRIFCFMNDNNQLRLLSSFKRCSLLLSMREQPEMNSDLGSRWLDRYMQEPRLVTFPEMGIGVLGTCYDSMSSTKLSYFTTNFLYTIIYHNHTNGLVECVASYFECLPPLTFRN